MFSNRRRVEQWSKGDNDRQDQQNFLDLSISSIRSVEVGKQCPGRTHESRSHAPSSFKRS